MANLVDLNDYDLVDRVLDCAFKIKNRMFDFSSLMAGKLMGSMFFEPSTRTHFSFQAAMYKMGGQCLCMSDVKNSSSVAKGESFSDTVKIMSLYSDFIVIRHKNDGAAKAASIISNCPVINAGDGVHLHPTQTLIDLFTIKELKKTLGGFCVGFCGDLKFSRPVNSLVAAMCRQKDISFYFVSTEEQRISAFLKNLLNESGVDFVESRSLEEVISKLDVLYMTRVQKERFNNIFDYERQKGRFILNKENLNLAKSDLIVLHPLPRVDEIAKEVDSDARAAYFLQAKNGVFVRMALILNLFSSLENKNKTELCNFKEMDLVCSNENCISHFDVTLPKFFNLNKKHVSCFYCDEWID